VENKKFIYNIFKWRRIIDCIQNAFNLPINPTTR
jgi:hypothetical protein